MPAVPISAPRGKSLDIGEGTVQVFGIGPVRNQRENEPIHPLLAGQKQFQEFVLIERLGHQQTELANGSERVTTWAAM